MVQGQYIVCAGGTNEILSGHSTLELALRSAVGSYAALGGERTVRRKVDHRIEAVVDADGFVNVYPAAAVTLWL